MPVCVHGRNVGDLLAHRQVGGWFLRLTRDRCQRVVPAPDGRTGRIEHSFVWNIVATHPHRDPMVFVYGLEKEARAALGNAEEVDLFEAAAIGEVLS